MEKRSRQKNRCVILEKPKYDKPDEKKGSSVKAIVQCFPTSGLISSGLQCLNIFFVIVNFLVKKNFKKLMKFLLTPQLIQFVYSSRSKFHLFLQKKVLNSY